MARYGADHERGDCRKEGDWEAQWHSLSREAVTAETRGRRGRSDELQRPKAAAEARSVHE